MLRGQSGWRYEAKGGGSKDRIGKKGRSGACVHHTLLPLYSAFVLDQLHEAVIHVELLMTVQERVAGVVGDEVYGD